MNKRRLNIGFLISELEDAYTRSLCEGAVSAAKELDANLFLFPGRYFDAPYQDLYRTQYDYQFNSLFEFATTSQFDVILISMGTIAGNVDKEYKRRFLERFKGIPVIVIASDLDGYPSVCFDNKTGFYAGIEHLIKSHGCKKIGYVSGTITCDDAIERLETYYEVLKDNGIERNEDYVVYGNFSEYSQDVVRDLMTRNPDLDAVVFANDMMAIGGYEVFDELGIEVGKKLSVMGFDDAACAMSLEPTLTSTKADAVELGYQAVISAPEIIAGRKKNVMVGSIPVHRESCGCKIKDYTQLNIRETDLLDNSRVDYALDLIYRYLFDKNANQAGTIPIKKEIAKYFFFVRERILSKDISSDDFDKLYKMMRSLCRMKLEPYTDFSKIFYFIDCIYGLLKHIIQDSNLVCQLSETYYSVYQDVTEYVRKLSDDRKSDVGWLNYISTTFTRDVLNFAIGDDRGYLSIVEKLPQLYYESAYLCIFPEESIHEKNEPLYIPDNILIKAYLKDGKACCADPEQQTKPLKNLFTDLYNYNENRVTAVITLLFAATEQYGLFISEIQEDYIHYTTPITYQISSAVKTINLLKNKEVVTNKLEESLEQIKESNAILDEISKSDELTHIYNRRGFLTTVQHQVAHPENVGKRAVMIYADMNNLKLINDRFGHEEGDYSLRLISSILKEAFGDNGIVGRFGGDEFVGFMLAPVENITGALRKKITSITKDKNEGNGKPYYVCMSVGICEFKCGEKVELQDVVDKADVDLYIEKRHKRSNILKNESEAI